MPPSGPQRGLLSIARRRQYPAPDPSGVSYRQHSIIHFSFKTPTQSAARSPPQFQPTKAFKTSQKPATRSNGEAPDFARISAPRAIAPSPFRQPTDAPDSRL